MVVVVEAAGCGGGCSGMRACEVLSVERSSSLSVLNRSSSFSLPSAVPGLHPCAPRGRPPNRFVFEVLVGSVRNELTFFSFCRNRVSMPPSSARARGSHSLHTSRQGGYQALTPTGRTPKAPNWTHIAALACINVMKQPVEGVRGKLQSNLKAALTRPAHLAAIVALVRSAAGDDAAALTNIILSKHASEFVLLTGEAATKKLASVRSDLYKWHPKPYTVAHPIDPTPAPTLDSPSPPSPADAARQHAPGVPSNLSSWDLPPAVVPPSSSPPPPPFGTPTADGILLCHGPPDDVLAAQYRFRDSNAGSCLS